MSSTNNSWHRVIVTGASKGFGNAFALCYATAFRYPVHFVLSGRNEGQLEKLRDEITKVRDASGKQTAVDIVVADFAQDPSTSLAGTADKLFVQSTKAGVTYARTVFLNNAGTLGFLRFIGKDNTSFEEMHATTTLNLTVPLFLTSQFMQYYDSGTMQVDAEGDVRVVNMSSLAGVQAFNSWGMYGSLKAAKDMYFATLALERKDDAKVRVLNYAPGPLDTNMQREIRESTTECPLLREQYTKLAADGGLVSPLDAAKKLLRLLTVDASYTSGGHVDYYDVIPGIDVNTVGVTTCCACPFCTCGPDCQCKSRGAPSCDPCVVDISLKKAKIERLDAVDGASSSSSATTSAGCGCENK